MIQIFFKKKCNDGYGFISLNAKIVCFTVLLIMNMLLDA